jgi:NADPH:quinone reductase-like Zn-dependent oxidoreductase
LKRPPRYRERLPCHSPRTGSKLNHVSCSIGFLTAAATINIGLKVPLPGLTATDTSTTQPQSILILGGSSNVGAAAVQLLRLALPTAAIITTSSPEHHAKLTLLGATVTLERNAQQDAAAIRAASPGGAGIDALIDAVGAASDSPAVLAAFRDDGPKLYTVVRNRMDEKLPDGFQTSRKCPHLLPRRVRADSL